MNEAVGNLGNIGGLLMGFAQQALNYLPRVILALVVLWIGFRVIGWIVGLITKQMNARNMDPSLTGFLSSIISILFKAALFIAVASTLGVETTSFVAMLGAAGLAVGLALQGNLANFAGGVMILLFKPFQVNDYIKAQGVEGFVKDISIFVTKLETHDGETHYVPNGGLSSNNITNVAQHGKIRVHIPGMITYDSNIDTARSAILAAVGKHPLVMSDPAPSMIVSELGQTGVQLMTRVWCTPGDVPAVTGDCNEIVKKTIDAAGLKVPVLQDILLKK